MPWVLGELDGYSVGIRIVADSVCDTDAKLDAELNITKVPLTLYFGDREFKDDGTLTQQEIIELMRSSSVAPRTASPSPGQFVEAIKGAGGDSTFVVTVSQGISSTYESATIAQQIIQSEDAGRFIHVFNSRSASVGEALVCMKIQELARQSLKVSEIVERVNAYIAEMKTFFLLDSLDNLVKSGRMGKVMGKIGSVLSLKLVLGASEEGTIKLFDKARGTKRAFRRLIDQIEEHGERLEEKILGVAHCNAREKAEALKAEVLERFNFKDIIIVKTAGVTSIYADHGGIVIAF